MCSRTLLTLSHSWDRPGLGDTRGTRGSPRDRPPEHKATPALSQLLARQPDHQELLVLQVVLRGVRRLPGDPGDNWSSLQQGQPLC